MVDGRLLLAQSGCLSYLNASDLDVPVEVEPVLPEMTCIPDAYSELADLPPCIWQTIIR